MSSRSSRNKRRSRRKKQDVQKAAASGATGNVLDDLSEVRRALAEGRARRAWATARQLVKNGGLPEPDIPLIVDALSARLTEMLTAGHSKEAVDMARDLLRQHPDWAEHLGLDLRLRLECNGGQPSMLTQYGVSPEATDGIDDWVRCGLADPTQLADLDSLPGDHPLRFQSRLVRDAWMELEGGESGDAYAALGGIPRRSPFSPWRLFLQALRAYYAQDDRDVLKTLAHIPVGTVAAAAGELLKVLLSGRTAEHPAAAELVGASPLVDLRRRWAAVLESIERLDFRACRSRMTSFGQVAMRMGYRSLALDGLAFAMQSFEGRPDLFGPGDCRWAKGWDPLAVARTVAMHGSLYPDTMIWDIVFSSPVMRLSDLETALVFSHLAGQEARSLRGDNEFYEMEGIEDEDNGEAEDWFARSVGSYALSETFSKWHEFRLQQHRDGTEVLRRWQEAFPGDPEPFYLMVHSARGGDATAAAGRAFDRLVELEGRSPRVQALEPFFLLEQALATFESGDFDGGSALMLRVEDDVPIVQVACQCVWSLVSSMNKNRTGKVVTGRALAELERPFLVWHCFRVLRPAFPKGSLPAGVKRQFDDPQLVILGLMDLLAITDEQWRLPGIDQWCGDFEDAIRAYEGATSQLLDLLAALRQYDSRLLEHGVLEVAFMCTLNGLAREDEAFAVFLAYRAVVYAAYATSRCRWRSDWWFCLEEAAADCWQLVDWFSSKAPNCSDVIRQLANAGERERVCEGRKPLSKKKRSKILREETGCTDLEDAIYVSLARHGDRVPMHPPFGFGGQDDIGFEPDDYFDDVSDAFEVPDLMDDGVDFGQSIGELTELGRAIGMSDAGIARALEEVIGSGPGEREQPPPAGRRPGGRARRPPADGGPGGGPEQLDFPGFEF